MIQQLPLPESNQPSWVYLPGNHRVVLSRGSCETYRCGHDDVNADDDDIYCDLFELDQENILEALNELNVSTRVIYANSESEIASIQLEIPGLEAVEPYPEQQFSVHLSYAALARHLGTQYTLEGIDYIRSFILPVTSVQVTFPDGEVCTDDSFLHYIWDDDPFSRIDVIGSAPHAGLEASYTILQSGSGTMLLKVDPERLAGFLESVTPFNGQQNNQQAA